MRDVIERDLFRRTGQVGLPMLLRQAERDPAFRWLLTFRLATQVEPSSLGMVVWKLLNRSVAVRAGIQVPRSVHIGPGLVIPHFGGIVINSEASVGNNCTVLHGVTIGNVRRGRRFGVPTIGNRVYLGPGSTIVGGIDVGDDVLVAPNAFVNVDVPRGSTAIGNPVRIVPPYRGGGSGGYILNLPDALS